MARRLRNTGRSTAAAAKRRDDDAALAEASSNVTGIAPCVCTPCGASALDEEAGAGAEAALDVVHSAFLSRQGEFLRALLRDRVAALVSWVSAMRGAGCDDSFIMDFISEGFEAAVSPAALAFYGCVAFVDDVEDALAAASVEVPVSPEEFFHVD